MKKISFFPLLVSAFIVIGSISSIAMANGNLNDDYDDSETYYDNNDIDEYNADSKDDNEMESEYNKEE